MDKIHDSTTQQQPGPLEPAISKLLEVIQPPANAAPTFSKEDPMPVLSHISSNAFVLTHALWPALVQIGYSQLSGGKSLPFVATVLLYNFAYINMIVREDNAMSTLGLSVGYLDGDQHGRDQVSHRNLLKAIFSVSFFTIIRPWLVVFVGGWNDNWNFSTISPWLPVELLLYSIIVDFWFYSYHRACHEVNFLWKFHKTHHLTKHPIPVLASFSDIEQELIEVIAIPLLSYLTAKLAFGLPMPFYDWWICQAYILFGEIMGHSGLRVYAMTPGLSSYVLSFIGCELIIEDHDLHHRKGWRKSSNYGKQTMVWDRLFGTKSPRLESEHVDFEKEVCMPLF